MELELAGDAGATHAEVLERASETGLLMPLEVGERHHDVGIGEGRADFRGLAVFAVDLYLALVGALEAVGDDHLALRGDGVEAVLHGALQMVDGVGAASGVEGVAVGEERLAPEGAYYVGHACGEVGADVCHIAGLAEMYLQGHEVILDGEVGEAGAAHETLQLVGEAGVGIGAQVCEEDFCRFHIYRCLRLQ